MEKIFIGTGSGSECKMSAHQNTLVYNFFIENNYLITNDVKNANILILNNCFFEEFEEKIALLSISYYLQKYPNKKIYLIGCVPKSMMSDFSSIPNISIIGLDENYKFDNHFKKTTSINSIQVGQIRYFPPLNIDSLNAEDFGYKKIHSDYKYKLENLQITIDDVKNNKINISGIKEYDSDYRYLEDISGEYFVEICQGCSNDCSYCIIKEISGFVKSYKLEDLISKIKNGLSLGYKTITLISEDCGSYGLDIGLNISILLNKINELEGDFKVKIVYFEPGRLLKNYQYIDKSFFENRLISIGVSLQTTSQRVLKLMNRNYNIENVIKIISEIKSINNDIFISTEFIYGFPSETFEEFLDYFNSGKINNFDFILYHYYSERKGTLASRLQNKLSKGDLFKRILFLSKIMGKNKKIHIKNETIKELIDVIKNKL